jgi:hypothetical protein
MQGYTVYLYLETALHISDGISTHHQERIQLYLQHLVFVTPLLLSADIVEMLEPVCVCCGWRTPQHPILKHPQPAFLPQCQRPGFTPIQNQEQNYSFIYLDLSVFG